MRNKGAIFLGLSGLFAAASILYYKGAKAISLINLGNISFKALDDFSLEFILNNPTAFAYPMPTLLLNLFNNKGELIGSIETNDFYLLQPGNNVIKAQLKPVLDKLAITLALKDLSPENGLIDVKGNIKIGNWIIPFTETLNLN